MLKVFSTALNWLHAVTLIACLWSSRMSVTCSYDTWYFLHELQRQQEQNGQIAVYRQLPLRGPVVLHQRSEKHATGKYTCHHLTRTRYVLHGGGIETRWEARFSAPVQTGPGPHPASCKMGTMSLSGG